MALSIITPLQAAPLHASPARIVQPLDFTARMRLICEDMASRLPELDHVDMSRVAVAFSQARSSSRHGLFASLTPLRFIGGAEVGKRRGRTYRIQRLCDRSGREMLYILRFCLPRFLDLDLREKLITVLHELWHISPEFNGDIRRHAGRYHAHTHSQAEYDEQMGLLADHWLAARPPDEIWDFLRHDYLQLAKCHGRIVGVKIPRPLLVPIE
jgi:predicted metallopeptidase